MSLTGKSTDFVGVDYIHTQCNINKGLQFLDDKWLRNIISDLHRLKAKLFMQ